MATELKIEANNPNLLVKYRAIVKNAMEKGVREALAERKAARNPIAVSRDGKVILLQADEINTEYSSLEAIWGTEDVVKGME
ncbi:hypothetical protein BH20ACI2_BH20ACI2_20050 [soil metagenome]